MGNLIVSGKFDSLYLRESDNRVFIVVEIYDDYMEMPQHVAVDVTDELEEIYKEMDKIFVKKIEKKLKHTFKNKTLYLKYFMCGNYILATPLKELYSPVTLTPDKVKFGDPLKLKATVMNFRREDEGEGFPLAGILAECIIGDLRISCCKGIDHSDVDVFYDTVYSDEVELEIAYVDVDAEFEHIYNELLAFRCNRTDFVGKKNRLLSKQEVYNIIANKLLGQVITLEYDEYYGYSVWDYLIYTIDKNYK